MKKDPEHFHREPGQAGRRLGGSSLGILHRATAASDDQ
jgi:hypothetical protein